MRLQFDPVRMKTDSGNVVSSKPISLPKAAKILSKFVTIENGASHAISTYLQHASTAFEELAHLHKKLKAPKSQRKSKHHKPRRPLPMAVPSCSSGHAAAALSPSSRAGAQERQQRKK